jgi:large subunit ribosomal protein L18
MAKGPRYSVPYKRKRDEKTDYRKRLALLKSGRPRFVVRKTNKRVIVQLVKFTPKGDKTLFTVSNIDLKKYGFKPVLNNLPASYLTGYLGGKLAVKEKVKQAVLDIGLSISSKGNKLYAALKGGVDAGLRIPHSEKILPSAERIRGEHIKDFDKTIVEKVKKKIDEKVKKR